jgi:hypothetical protein
MRIECEALRPLLQTFSLVQNCDVVRNGMLRIQTPFQYPDGSHIDLFLGRDLENLVLTDLGQTTGYLLDLHVKPWTTKKRKTIVSDICRSIGVQQTGSEYQIRFNDADVPTLPQLLVRLAQACIRVSDIAMTQRLRVATVFREDFEEFLASSELDYTASPKITGQFDREIETDFLVRGQNVESLIQTLSTANSAAAHGLANEVFRKWYDLSNVRQRYQSLTVYDTNNDVFREDDIARLGTLSTVFGFPANEEQILETLVA